MELKRCFIAVKLEKEATDEIKKIQDSIRDKNVFFGKFTKSKNLHLTLKFLGEIDENKIEGVKERLMKIKFKKFKAKFEKLGVFSNNIVKIIWIELLNVFNLQKEIDESLKDLFNKEGRFMSHITIARVKKVYNKDKLISCLSSIKNNFTFNIDSFYLMESELKPTESVYKEIKKYNLES